MFKFGPDPTGEQAVLGALLRFGFSSKFFVHLLVFDTIVAAAALLPNDLDLLVCSLHIYEIPLVYGKHRILKKNLTVSVIKRPSVPRLSVRLSVPYIDSSSDVQRVCC